MQKTKFFFKASGAFLLAGIVGIVFQFLLLLVSDLVMVTTPEDTADWLIKALIWPSFFAANNPKTCYLLGTALFIHFLRKTPLYRDLYPKLGVLVSIALVFGAGVAGMDLIQDIIYAIGEYRGEGVASTFGIRVDADGNATSLDVVEHYRPWKEFAIGMTRWRYVVAMVLTFSYVLLRASREIQRSK